MAQVNLITQAAYARHRGVSEASVSKAVKENRISLIDGKIDAAIADAQWARNTRVRAGSSQSTPTPTEQLQLVAGETPNPAADGEGAPGASGYTQSRARREAADAEMAEMELRARRGELIEIKAVELVWSSALASMREHLLQVRARLAPLLAVESETFKVEQLLDQEHNKALNFLAGVQLAGPGEA